jgi:hypothetical protein
LLTGYFNEKNNSNELVLLCAPSDELYFWLLALLFFCILVVLLFSIAGIVISLPSSCFGFSGIKVSLTTVFVLAVAFV